MRKPFVLSDAYVFEMTLLLLFSTTFFTSNFAFIKKISAEHNLVVYHSEMKNGNDL